MVLRRFVLLWLWCQVIVDLHDVLFPLTNWPLRDVEVILQRYFSNSFYAFMHVYTYWTFSVKLVLDECHKTSLMICQQLGSGNILVPSGNKPSHEPTLTKIITGVTKFKQAPYHLAKSLQTHLKIGYRRLKWVSHKFDNNDRAPA